jgi:hypothetical protein
MNDSDVLDGDNLESQQPKKRNSAGAKKVAAKQHSKSEDAQAVKILTKRECLSGLSQLPGLLTMKLINATQANAIARVYSILLQHEKDEASRTNQAGLSEPALIETLRKNPELVNQIAQLLTPEQFAYLERQIQETNDA